MPSDLLLPLLITFLYFKWKRLCSRNFAICGNVIFVQSLLHVFYISVVFSYSFYNQFVWYLSINCSISNHIYLLLGWYSTVYKCYWKSAYCYFTKKGSNSGIVGGIQWYMVWVPSLKLVGGRGGVLMNFMNFELL